MGKANNQNSVLWTLIYQCTVNTISHKCSGDTKFGVRIVTNLGHQIGVQRTLIFYSVCECRNEPKVGIKLYKLAS